MAVHTFPAATKLTVGIPRFAQPRCALRHTIPAAVGAVGQVAFIDHTELWPTWPMFNGQVPLQNDWRRGDPSVFFPDSLKTDRDDGLPVKEALFVNHNADIQMWVDSLSLIGRTALGRGVAHKITALSPLKLENYQLKVDPTATTPSPWVLKVGDVMTGDLNIYKATPNINLNRIGLPAASITGYKDGALRWRLDLGEGYAETGGNAGSNFALHWWKDDGSYGAKVINIDRATGGTTFTGLVTSTGTITSIVNGSTFGQADGASAAGVVTQADANIKLYNATATNWAGFGADGNGNMWFRVGVGGTNEIPAMFLSPADRMLYLSVGGTVPTPPVVANTRIANTAYVEQRGNDWGNYHAAPKINRSGDSMTGALGFGNRVAGSPTDLSQHLSLYSNTYGFTVTGGTLNFVSNGASMAWLTSTAFNTSYIRQMGDGDRMRWRGDRFSVITHHNNDAFYLMLTNDWEPDSGWNTLRPFVINKNGNVTMSHAVNVGSLSSGAIGGSTVDTGGATMRGGTYAYIRWGAGTAALEVRSGHATWDSFLSFHIVGSFGCFFGLKYPDWNLYYGGWSFGDAEFMIHTTRNLNQGLLCTNARLLWAGDSGAGPSGPATFEPFAGGVCTGYEGYNYTIINLRWRYMQIYTNDWYTIGYAG